MQLAILLTMRVLGVKPPWQRSARQGGHHHRSHGKGSSRRAHKGGGAKSDERARLAPEDAEAHHADMDDDEGMEI